MPPVQAKDQDSDASPEEDGLIDLDNLPEDRHERLRLLGVDQSLIEEGGDFLDMIEQGAIDELARSQERTSMVRDKK